jgi:hypothetical protein
MILHYFNRLRQAQIPTGGSAPSFTFVSESASKVVTAGIFRAYSIDLEIGISTLSVSTNANATSLTGSDAINVYVDYGGGTPTTSSREVAQTSIVYNGTNWEIDDSETVLVFSDPYNDSSQAKYLIVATNSSGTTQTIRTLTY